MEQDKTSNSRGNVPRDLTFEDSAQMQLDTNKRESVPSKSSIPRWNIPMSNKQAGSEASGLLFPEQDRGVPLSNFPVEAKGRTDIDEIFKKKSSIKRTTSFPGRTRRKKTGREEIDRADECTPSTDVKSILNASFPGTLERKKSTPRGTLFNIPFETMWKVPKEQKLGRSHKDKELLEIKSSRPTVESHADQTTYAETSFSTPEGKCAIGPTSLEDKKVSTAPGIKKKCVKKIPLSSSRTSDDPLTPQESTTPFHFQRGIRPEEYEGHKPREYEERNRSVEQQDNWGKPEDGEPISSHRRLLNYDSEDAEDIRAFRREAARDFMKGKKNLQSSPHSSDEDLPPFPTELSYEYETPRGRNQSRKGDDQRFEDEECYENSVDRAPLLSEATTQTLGRRKRTERTRREKFIESLEIPAQALSPIVEEQVRISPKPSSRKSQEYRPTKSCERTTQPLRVYSLGEEIPEISEELYDVTSELPSFDRYTDAENGAICRHCKLSGKKCTCVKPMLRFHEVPSDTIQADVHAEADSFQFFDDTLGPAIYQEDQTMQRLIPRADTRPKQLQGERDTQPKQLQGERDTQPKQLQGERDTQPKQIQGERDTQPKQLQGERDTRPKQLQGERQKLLADDGTLRILKESAAKLKHLEPVSVNPGTSGTVTTQPKAALKVAKTRTKKSGTWLNLDNVTWPSLTPPTRTPSGSAIERRDNQLVQMQLMLRRERDLTVEDQLECWEKVCCCGCIWKSERCRRCKQVYCDSTYLWCWLPAVLSMIGFIMLMTFVFLMHDMYLYIPAAICFVLTVIFALLARYFYLKGRTCWPTE